jgi:hypothetical protein
MNGEGSKTSSKSIILIIGGIIILVLIIFALFPSPQQYPQLKKGGLTVKLHSNTNLKSNSYFNLNLTIQNTYDVTLENTRVWMESGSLFTVLSKPLSKDTTLRTYPAVPLKTNMSYFFGNIKVEKVDVEMKKVPILLKIVFQPRITHNFTINAANNNTLQFYGGIENLGIKEVETKRKISWPLSISFSFNARDLVFREGGKEESPFKIIIENSGGGNCISDIKIKLQSEKADTIVFCVYNKTKLVVPFETFLKPSNKIEIPCNFTLSQLREKDFISHRLNISLSCDYLEEMRFYFNIYP